MDTTTCTSLTTVTATITDTTNATPTNPSILPVSAVNTFTNIIPNISSYKQNLIHQLLGTQGRATHTNQNNTTAPGQIAFTGPVSPVDQVNDKLKSLLANLQQPLEQLSNLTIAIKKHWKHHLTGQHTYRLHSSLSFRYSQSTNKRT